MNQKKNPSKDTTIDFSSLYETHLSIQLGLDGLSFCTIDKKDNKVRSLEHHSFADGSPTPEKHLSNVRSLFEKEEALQRRYGSVNISHDNQLATLVPKPLFDEAHLKDYIRYSSKTYDNDYIVFDEIENHDMINVYIPFVNVNNFFLERFGSFEYKHASTILISSLLNTYKFSEHPHMFAHIGEHSFDLLVIAGNRLLLHNSFTYQTKEDFLYYLLFTAEQLELNPETLELVLSGNIRKAGPLYEIAYTYIRNVNLLENRSKMEFSDSIDEDSKRRHFTLLNQF